MSSQQKNSEYFTRRSAILAILCLGPLPTLGVAIAAFGEPGIVGQSVWLFAKLGLLIGPAMWWKFVQRQPCRLSKPSIVGFVPGLISAIALAAIIFLSYWWVARPLLNFNELRAMLAGLGINTKTQYFLLAGYLTLINSFIEEYVFRWFFYRQFQRLMPPVLAVFSAALLFTVHHTVVLAAYIPWYFNALASFGVFSGGLIWSFLYFRYKQIWPAYISHIGADVGVFLIGYHMIFS